MYANQTIKKNFLNVIDVESYWGRGEDFFIGKMMEIGAIPGEGSLSCRKCSRPNRMVVLRKTKQGTKYFWYCSGCKKRFSIYCGTIFEKCNDKKKLLQLLVLFLHKSSNDLAVKTTRFSHSCVSDNYHKFSKIISEIMASRPPLLIGGEGHIVQIDESCISKRKYNRGHRMANQMWLFGGIDTTTKKCFFFDVARRNRATLLPLICDNIALGTEIWSDGWAAYRNLADYGYSQKWVNHKETYVNEDGSNTNYLGCFKERDSKKT